MRAFFIGAGSSQGTLSNRPLYPPVATDFGCQLTKRVSNWHTEYPALSEVAKHLQAPLSKLGLAEIWTCIDYYAKFQCVLRAAPWCKGEGSRNLKRALLRLYGQACDKEADKLPQSDNYTLGQLLKNRVQPGDALISFNYDTLVERLALKFGHRLRNFGGELRDDIVNLAKPHGSTSWCLDLKEKRVTWTEPDNVPRLNSLDESEVHAQKEPLVLGAVPIKSELIKEVQKQYRLAEVYTVVMSQWKAVVDAVKKAEVFVVVGYSFPKEDQYGRFLFREAIRVRCSPPRIEYYELPARAAATEASILEAFGAYDGLELVYHGQVLPPQDGLE